jgi:hypothetical protein
VTYEAMLLVVVFAAFAVANVTMSGVAALLWRAARRDADRLSPAARARGLFLVRLLPAGATRSSGRRSPRCRRSARSFSPAPRRAAG